MSLVVRDSHDSLMECIVVHLNYCACPVLSAQLLQPSISVDHNRLCKEMPGPSPAALQVAWWLIINQIPWPKEREMETG